MFSLGKKSLIGSSLLQGAVDNHSHLLPAVDDGVRRIETTLEILEWLEGLGLKELWCTPHIMEDVPNESDTLKMRFEKLQESYKGKIELHLAAEYMLDNLYLQRLNARDLLFHGEGKVLVETSTVLPVGNVFELIFRTLSAGYKPIFAHPERYLYMEPQQYESLVSQGVVLQLNLPSILGFYGKDVARRAAWLLEKGYYSISGSDCHRFQRIQEQYSAKVLDKKTIERLRPLMGELL